MNYPVIIVEIPHQLPATAWVAFGVAALEAAGFAAGGDAWDWPEAPAEADYVEALGHDLHGLYILSPDEARSWEYSGHQEIKAKVAVAAAVAVAEGGAR